MLDSQSFLDGQILLVDKPLDWTSFDVVNKLRFGLRFATGNKKIKVGHAGTLDPKATGLLIICTGKATKQLDLFQNLSKSYSGTFVLGATTASYDTECEPDNFFETSHIDSELIETARLTFLGEQDQFPPIFSAIKVNGVAMYKSARAGKSVDIKSRNVVIHSFEVMKSEIENQLRFNVHCSKGTYIRSLAYDFGKAVQSGAYLGSLRRETIGEYDVKNAWQLNDLIEAIKALEPIKTV